MKIINYTCGKELPIVALFYGGEVREVPDFPGEYEDVATFKKYCCAAVETKFEMACDDLFPLLHGLPIASMGIYLTLENVGPAAYYINGESDAAGGRYYFQVHVSLIRHYLYQFWEAEDNLPENLIYVPHHEIIHMLDDREVNRFTQYYDHTDSREFLLSYFSHFRKEGLAELYRFLQQPADRISEEEARTGFLEDFLDLMAKNWRDPISFEELESRIFTHVAYSVGPWMILHALYARSEREDQKDRIVNIILDLQQGAEIQHDEILFLIKEGLDLNLESFITALGENNWVGISWIDSGVIRRFAYTLHHINESRKMEIIDAAKQAAHEKCLSVFKKLWIN